MTKLRLSVLGLVAVMIAFGTWASAQPDYSRLSGARIKKPAEILVDTDQDQLGQEIETFCSRCHSMPSPELYPAHHWPEEINRALGFHRASGSELTEPDNQALVAWFQSRALERGVIREQLAVPQSPTFIAPMVLRKANPTTISSLLAVGQGEDLAIYSTNLLSGQIEKSIDGSHFELCRLRFPARIRQCNLDDQCSREFLVADLGTPAAVDERVGQVIWGRERTVDGVSKAETQVLAEGLGRVADARSADFDGDGDEDVVIAEFGWDRVGSVILLENHGDRFEQRVLLDQHGPVEIEIGDLDNDGLEDIVVAFGQEFESIELFANRGGLKFDTLQLYRAETPAFGMSSVEVVDSDGDGDLDIAFTSGDMYDSGFTQPHHGLYLLTNDGSAQFSSSRLGEQVAAMSCEAGDIDNDGDIDFVVGAFIPEATAFSGSPAYPALTVFTQTSGGEFTTSVLKAGECTHTGIDLHDVDGDGDQDLLVGHFHDQSMGDRPAIHTLGECDARVHYANEVRTGGRVTVEPRQSRIAQMHEATEPESDRRRGPARRNLVVFGLALLIVALAVRWLLPQGAIDQYEGRLNRTVRTPLAETHEERFDASRMYRDRDRFVALDAPATAGASDANGLRDTDEVIGVEINGQARAYPTRIVGWHHIVNDVVGEVPIAVSYCSICSCGVAFRNSPGSDPVLFGFEGAWQGTLMLYDRQTGSTWLQMTGECIDGPQLGEKIDLLHPAVVSWGTWRKSHPGTDVVVVDDRTERTLSREEARAGSSGLAPEMRPTIEDRNTAVNFFELVYGIQVEGTAIAFPASKLLGVNLAECVIEGVPVVVAGDPNRNTALVGFHACVDGQRIRFSRMSSTGLVEATTGSIFDLSGVCQQGPMAGTQLEPIGFRTEWYGWYASHPHTQIWNADNPESAERSPNS